MDFPKSVPGVGLVDGKFIDEDAVAGTPGSLIPSMWGNSVTLELLKVIEEAGLSPDEDDNTQLNAAIDQKISESSVEFASAIQTQANTAFTTGGTATVLTLTPSPAIQAYAANQRFSVKFNVSSGADPTLNVSAKGAKSLKQYDANGAKVSATFAANQISDIVYDGVDWIVLDPLSADLLSALAKDVASASNVNLTTAAPSTRQIVITGTTTINGFTIGAGQCYIIRFSGVLTLTNGASLVTQSGANIVTAPGDTCIIRATAANVVEILCFTPGIPQELGYRQTQQNVLASRALNTTYTNNTSCTIWVSVSVNMSAGTGPLLLLDGVTMANNANNGSGATILTFSFPVRPFGEYRINGGLSAAYWSELR